MARYLIIGGSSGIGLQLVKSLDAEGHEVLVASRTKDQLTGLNNVEHIFHDVLRNDVLEVEGALDGMAYCPGSINLKPFHRLKKEDFEQDFQLNLLGAVQSIQSALPALRKSESAAIVMFSTVAVGQGMAFHTSVAAAKGAIEGFSKALSAELAPRIRVNTIAPSIVNTPLASRLLSNEDKIAASAKRHPLAKIGAPEDIAEMAAFLLSDKAKWITGQIIGIDGGMSAIKMM